MNEEMKIRNYVRGGVEYGECWWDENGENGTKTEKTSKNHEIPNHNFPPDETETRTRNPNRCGMPPGRSSPRIHTSYGYDDENCDINVLSNNI